MPKNYTEYTEKEIKELIAKAHDVPVTHVTLIHITGTDDDVDRQHYKPPSVRARVLLKEKEDD